MENLKGIFKSLGMNDSNGLHIHSENDQMEFLPARTAKLIKKLNPRAFFCIDNKPLVLFYDSPENKEELFKNIWNFNESPIVIVNEPDSVDIFNGLSYLKEERTLEKLEEESKLDAFSYFKLVTGKTWQTYEKKLKYENRVDYKLLENIRTARDLLINDHKIEPSLSNALIGKCIFVRYLIDREVRIKFDGTNRKWSNDEFCTLLKDKEKTIKFLKYLKVRFNGEAFLLEDSRLNKIPQKAFNVLSHLMNGTEIASGQTTLFDIYDFSIIPVEFISNVYEYFIGSEDQATQGAYYTPLFLVDYIVKETIDKYFEANTEEYNCKVLDPACGSGIFLVEALRRMIVRYTKIKNITSTETNGFKETIRKIAEENIYGIDKDDNAINVALFSVYLTLLDYQEPKDIETFKFPELLNKNFFRSDFFDQDADFNAIIKKINFNFILGNPPWKRGSKEDSYLFSWDDVPESDSEQLLKFLNDDLKIGLGENPKIEKSDDGESISITKDSDKLTFKLNKEKKKVNLEIVGGGSYEYSSKKENDKLNIYKTPLFLQYIKDRKKKELKKSDRKPQITISNKEIAQAFLLRTSDFTGEQTRCALIVTSKTLYNLNAKDFRQYLLHNYFIDKVFELAPVRREVFDKSNDPSIAPAAVLFFHYARGESTHKNVIEHIALKPNRFFSLFKVFMLQRNDYKQVVQSKLIKYDWLWKTLVYGSYLDFNFIRRLKGDYKTIGEIITDKNDFLVKQGIKLKDGSNEIDVTELEGWNFLETRRFDSFFIPPDNYSIWKKDEFPSVVGYIYREDKQIVKKLYESPILLIKGGTNKELESVSAISYENCVFKSSLTGIKLIDSKKLNTLKIINGLLNSNLFSYNLLQTGASAGIEREESEDEEKWAFPYINNATVEECVENIEAISEKIFKEKQGKSKPNIQILEDEKKKLIKNLNDEILDSFDLNEPEMAIVDYAVDVTIPLIMKHEGYEKKLFSPLKIEDPFLTDYADVFLNRFKNSFKNKKFTVQIQRSDYIIGMFFNVIDEKNKEEITWKSPSDDELLLLSRSLSIGYREITKFLFIQKDIRGFERDRFYIIKPNEKKLWHKAVAYLDLEEFVDAILISGREVENG
ncbi:MAG: hypothetical protein A7316_10345 [Candidatus Altiarchaeales archaeon WOR_SM1_86-2]|nr:MAG: hypothetical protein A7316_10345 [Candidatus Altiarchaeales archaeon WOR_SM1_86-2]ODS37998.1 MAG: hypothetical protein A7315_12945 [Candidatus Altiarchaeales archaeon WOR_SM1_79]